MKLRGEMLNFHQYLYMLALYFLQKVCQALEIFFLSLVLSIFSKILFLLRHGLFVNRGDGEHLFVSGDGIGSGDYFYFYHSDPKAALSSCSNVSKNFRNLKLDWRSCQLHAGGVGSKEVVGGLVFSCWGRGESFFGHSNVDSSPFLDNFPGIPMAGIFCYGEVGRGFTMLNADDHEDQEENTSCCCLHVYSTIYVLVSYTPAPLKH